MSEETDVMDLPEAIGVRERPADSQTRPFYWSVRRELFENRFVVAAPLAIAGIVLIATLLNTLTLPSRLRAVSPDDPASAAWRVVAPLSMAPAAIMIVALLVGFFYCLDALFGERRDRSILFWKSMPVSDRTVVMSKAAIPLAVLPALAFLLSVVTVAIVFLASTVVLAASGAGAALLWREYNFVQEPAIMAYGLAVHALWFAPLYGWLLLVSAWAKRAPAAWAILPLFAIAAVERIVTGNSSFMQLLKYRFLGAMDLAFVGGTSRGFDELSQLQPVQFLMAPGLWLGLAFASVFLVAAERLRRGRDPI